MNRHRRLVFLSDQVDQLGGVQRVVHTLADGLTDRGHQVDIMGLEPGCPRTPLPTRHPFPTRTAADAPTTLPYEPSTRSRRFRLAVRGHWRGLRDYRSTLPRLRDLLTSDQPTTVILTQLRAAEHVLHAVRPWTAARRQGIRLLVQYHDACHAAFANGDLRRLRRIAPHVDGILALNDGDAEQFRAAGITRVSVARNPIDLASPPPARRRTNLVVAGARYHPQKALDILIRAWALLAPGSSSWQLEIHGDGPERARLQSLIDDLDINDSVRLAGPTDNFGTQLARATINVLSSRHEGMGLVLAEAMVAGVPCVSTDSGPGVRELIQPGHTGLLTPVGDVEELAKAMNQLMEDAGLREQIAHAAIAHIKQFGTEAVLDEWETLLRRGELTL